MDCNIAKLENMLFADSSLIIKLIFYAEIFSSYSGKLPNIGTSK